MIGGQSIRAFLVLSILVLHSHGCTAPGVHLEPRKYCHLCHLVGRVLLPGAAGLAPCDGTAPGKQASQSDRAPWQSYIRSFLKYSKDNKTTLSSF